MEFLKLIAEHRTPFLDKFFSVITQLGGEAIVIVVLCLLYWCISKRAAYKIGITYFISGLLVQGLKITFRVDRPWIKDPTFKPVESALEGANGYSFPSGHTQNITALCTSVGLSLKNIWIRVACVAAIITVAFSRLYLGVHTPTDVLAAFALTAAIAVIVQLCDIKFGEKLSEKRSILILSALLILISVSITVYTFILYNKVGIDNKYVTDCCKAAGAAVGFSVGFFIEHLFINFNEKADKIYKQAIKFAVGLAVALLLKSVIKSLFGEGFIVSFIRYFILVFWIMALWPMIFKRLFPYNEPCEKSAE